MTSPISLILSFEVGGQDIEWHVEYIPAKLNRHPLHGDEAAELEVRQAMLLTHVVGGRAMRLDILDLILESADGDLPDHILSELHNLAADATFSN